MTNENKSLLRSGLAMMLGNKRYVVWFWLLNVALAMFGAAAFNNQAHAMLDHSLYADRLVHGFDVAVLGEMIGKPDFGSVQAVTAPAFFFVFVFYAATALFLPGVFQGYASDYRLPRDDFFQACGRNLWRFVRLLIVLALVMGIVAGILLGIRGALVSAADQSTNELLPFRVGLAMQILLVLVLTVLRSAFDLAEADVVLSDQRAVRRSIGAGFRHAFRSLFRLAGSYLLVWILAPLTMVVGIVAWNKLVPATSVFGAFLVGQVTLIIILALRFWQRGIAVAYWQQKMVAPVVRPVVPFTPAPVAPPVVFDPPLPTDPTPSAP